MANQFPLTAAEKASFNRVVTTPPTKPLGDVLEQLGGSEGNEGGSPADVLDIYWDPQNGSDNNDGATEATPLLTWTAVSRLVPKNNTRRTSVILLSDIAPSTTFGSYDINIDAHGSDEVMSGSNNENAYVALRGQITPETVVLASSAGGTNPTELVLTMEAAVATSYVAERTFLRVKEGQDKSTTREVYAVKAISGTDVTIVTSQSSVTLTGLELELYVVGVEISQGVISLGSGCELRDLILDDCAVNGARAFAAGTSIGVSAQSCANGVVFRGTFGVRYTAGLYIRACTTEALADRNTFIDCHFTDCRFASTEEIRLQGLIRFSGGIERVGDVGSGNYKFLMACGGAVSKAFQGGQVDWLFEGTGTIFGLPQGGDLEVSISNSTVGATVTGFLYCRGGRFWTDDVTAPNGTVTGDAYTLEEGAVGQVGALFPSTGDNVVVGAAAGAAYGSLPVVDSTQLCRAYT